MIVLGLDTSTTACSVAIISGERVLASRSEAMARGHQERLASLVQEMMTEAGVTFGDLDRVGVTVGPGSFTGLRVGMAFAKGLALALDIAAVGVGTLEALAASMLSFSDAPADSLTPAQAGAQITITGGPRVDPGLRRDERIKANGEETVFVAAIDARRDQVYLQAFRNGRSLMAPQALAAAAAAAAVIDMGALCLAGSGAPLLAAHLPGATVLQVETPDPVVIARMAAHVRDLQPMRPLYLRAPDAKLPI